MVLIIIDVVVIAVRVVIVVVVVVTVIASFLLYLSLLSSPLSPAFSSLKNWEKKKNHTHKKEMSVKISEPLFVVHLALPNHLLI